MYINSRANKLAKILTVLIPVFAFTILVPSFENPIEARTGEVLGATTQTINNQLDKADFVVSQPYKIHFDQTLPENSRATLAYDLKTGKVLLERNGDLKVQTASLTKLLTSIVASEEPNFKQPIQINSEDHTLIKPILGLRNGDMVLPEELINAMLVGSANDAAITLANHFGGTEGFVVKMNKKAAELGMINSHFDNPVGFDSANNFSTAFDLKKLTEYALKNLPYDQVWKTENFYFKTAHGAYSLKNSNTLITTHPEIKSIKTGLTPLALGNMIVQAENALGDKIVVINLGSTNRNNSTLEAVNYVFSSFAWK